MRISTSLLKSEGSHFCYHHLRATKQGKRGRVMLGQTMFPSAGKHNTRLYQLVGGGGGGGAGGGGGGGKVGGGGGGRGGGGTTGGGGGGGGGGGRGGGGGVWGVVWGVPSWHPCLFFDGLVHFLLLSLNKTKPPKNEKERTSSGNTPQADVSPVRPGFSTGFFGHNGFELPEHVPGQRGVLDNPPPRSLTCGLKNAKLIVGRVSGRRIQKHLCRN